MLRALAVSFAIGLFGILPAASQELSPEEEAEIVKSFDLTLEGQSLFYSGRYVEAEVIFRQALDIHENGKLQSPLSLASALHNVGATVAQQGRLIEAEQIARRALALRIENDAVDNAIVSSWSLLASILSDLNQYAEARHFQTLVVDQTLNGADVDQTYLIKSVATLAYVTAQDGAIGEGIAILNQLVPMLAEMTGPDQARVLNALGRLSSMNGQPKEAEIYYRQSLEVSLQLPEGPNWSVKDKATVLGNLASVLRERGRVYEAQGLFEQALGMLEQVGITQSDTYATVLDGLGETHRETGNLNASYSAQRQSLDIRRAIFPETHPKLGASFSNLGLTLLQSGDFENAAVALEKAANIQRVSGDELRLARAQMNLSGAYGALGQHDVAINTAAQASAGLRDLLPDTHNEVLTAAFNEAWLHLGAGRSETALPLARNALVQFAESSWRLSAEETVGSGAFRDQRRQVLAVIAALWDESGQDGISEAFEAIQWAQASEAANVARRVSTRFAGGDDTLAQMIRARQNLTNLWAATDASLLSALSLGSETETLRAELSQIEGQIEAQDQQISEQFPEFTQLTQPRPINLADVQAGLGPDDAVLYPVTTEDETYVFAANATTVRWQKVALTNDQLKDAVQSLRRDLDPSGQIRAAAALDDVEENALAFDAGVAHGLYQDLLAPVADVLDRKKRVLVVKEGALTGLPLSVLLTEPTALESASDFASAPWLLRDHGFVTVPSAAAIVARTQRNTREPTVDFVGFGDPVFAGETRTAALRLPGGASLSDLAPLPGTRKEIEAIESALSDATIRTFVGSDASEETLKSSPDVAEAALLVFATHGLVAGELTGLAEPALAFSAPSSRANEDGLFTASEAAELDLAADWVVLSACNTAASDGSPGGEGLSGLASAFLYAGAQSLIVSHWPVRDDAAPLLTTATISAARAGTNRAQALQGAMLSLLESQEIPDASHPSVWAPFVLVGAD